MHPLRETALGAGGPTATREDERSLRGQCPLSSIVVVGNHGNSGQAQSPLDLGSTVVVAAVVAIEHQGDLAAREPRVRANSGERPTRVPEAPEIGSGDEERLVSQTQGGSV